MKKHTLFFCLLLSFNVSFSQKKEKGFVSLFDGKTFKGWKGDTASTWRIENGMLIGGSLVKKVPNNDFLCTTESYDNFILKLKLLSK